MNFNARSTGGEFVEPVRGEPAEPVRGDFVEPHRTHETSLAKSAIAHLQARPRLSGAVALFLLLAAVYSSSVDLRATRGASITGDEPFYLLTTQSLLQDGNLDLRNQYATRSYESFFDHPDGLWKQSVPLANGQILSPHEPGLSVLLIPGFGLAGLRGAQVEMLLLAALTFALAFVLVSRLTGRPALSWLVTAIVALSATAFVYATEIYPEVPAALCILLSLLLLSGERRGLWPTVALALLLSGLMWLGMKYAPLAALVGLAYLLQADARQRLTLVALGAASGAFYVWFHYVTFNDLTSYSVNTVYEGADAVNVLEAHLHFQDRVYRLWGLFVDRRFGIGSWAPFLLLTPLSLPLLARRGRMPLLVLGLILPQLLIATFVAITMMGWWFPGRTLMTVLPLLALPLTLLLARASLPLRALAGLAALITLWFTFSLQQAASAREVRLAVDPFDMQAALFRLSRQLFPNYQQWTADTVILTVVWLTLFVAGASLLARTEFLIWRGRRGATRGALSRLEALGSD